MANADVIRVLNHSTLEFRGFSKMAPADKVILDRPILER